MRALDKVGRKEQGAIKHGLKNLRIWQEDIIQRSARLFFNASSTSPIKSFESEAILEGISLFLSMVLIHIFEILWNIQILLGQV